MPVSRRTRVEHDKHISRVQNIIKEVGVGPKGVFIAVNLKRCRERIVVETGKFCDKTIMYGIYGITM